MSSCAFLRSDPPAPEKLPLSSWSPTSPKAVIIALHSFADYRAAFAEIGPWFQKRDIALYAYDQPGFGQNPNHGLWPGNAVLIKALEDTYRTVREKHPKTPVYLMGESMGGAVILSALSRHPEWDIEGIVLAAPGVRKDIDYRFGFNALLAGVVGVAPGASVTLNDRYGPPLSKAAQKRIKNDPHMLRSVRMDTYFGLIRLSDDASDRAENIPTRALILYGSADETIRPVAICRLHEALENSQLLYHANEPHLLLQGTRYISHLQDIHHWIQKKGLPVDQRRSAEALCATHRN